VKESHLLVKHNRQKREWLISVPKRSQHFIWAHNKAAGVLSLFSHNPKLSAIVIRT
jgi:hypothetical protein